jgi:Polyketide cyclase / dehydrase and lipid transport
MTVHIQVSQVIERPVNVVFDFLAREHVRNHPRWDPDIELEQASDGPIGVGTLIRRRNSRSGTPVEGTMEVVEFEPDQAFGTLIHDGPVEMRGRTTFEALGDGRTNITIHVELPGLDEASVDRDFLTGRMERSAQNMKQLIESEVPG